MTFDIEAQLPFGLGATIRPCHEKNTPCCDPNCEAFGATQPLVCDGLCRMRVKRGLVVINEASRMTVVSVVIPITVPTAVLEAKRFNNNCSNNNGVQPKENDNHHAILLVLVHEQDD